MIVAAMNPCPCGYFPDRSRCHCTPGQIRAYQRGISKPILERLDLCVEAAPVKFEEITEKSRSQSSAALRERVCLARIRQRVRFQALPHIRVNAEMGIREIERFCRLGSREQQFMQQIFTLKQLSMRTYHKLLKLARTIADLEEAENIEIKHLSEAVSYRGIEDQLFGREGL